MLFSSELYQWNLSDQMECMWIKIVALGEGTAEWQGWLIMYLVVPIMITLYINLTSYEKHGGVFVIYVRHNIFKIPNNYYFHYIIDKTTQLWWFWRIWCSTIRSNGSGKLTGKLSEKEEDIIDITLQAGLQCLASNMYGMKYGVKPVPLKPVLFQF